ncbi:MAG: ABC transporter permease [Lachnospirales bacterium]
MRENLFKESLKYVFEEHKNNFNNLLKLSKENMQQQTLRTSLGLGWVVFRDLIYYIVFILFRLLMSGSGTVEGMNFILFLLLGLVPWNFMGECINGGVTAIKRNKQILASIKFPIVILPTVEVLAIFIKRLFTLLILLISIIYFGDIKNITLWMLMYYFICMFVIMAIWNLIFSSLVAISNDFEQLYRAITNVLFYSMPIIWSFETLGNNVGVIRLFKLNPFVYIIEGFRNACVTGKLPDLQYTIYFWVLSFVLLVIGSVLQYKLRRHYIDLI